MSVRVLLRTGAAAVAMKPSTVEELLAWADAPLAAAEVAAIAQLDPVQARVALSRVARPLPAGADSYWTLASCVEDSSALPAA